MAQDGERSTIDPPSRTEIDEELLARDEFGETLATHGYTDVLVLSREAGADVLAGERPALLDHLRTNHPESIRELARQVDRDKGDVSRDLSLLSELGIVEYVDGPRGAKAPRLTHEHVVIEPIV